MPKPPGKESLNLWLPAELVAEFKGEILRLHHLTDENINVGDLGAACILMFMQAGDEAQIAALVESRAYTLKKAAIRLREERDVS